MAFIETPDTVKVAVHYLLFSQQWINTLWFESQGSTSWNGSTINQLCEDVWTWADAEIMSILSNDCFLTLVDGVDQSAPSSFYGSYAASPVIGSAAAQSAPSGVCITVKFASDLTGRSYRGRNYVSGIPSTGISDNEVTSTFANALIGAYDLLSTYLTLADVYHVIVSHYTGGAERAAGVTVNVQDYQIVDYNLDSQRRRLTGRGT